MDRYDRKDYMTYTKEHKVEVITPQCKSCDNYDGVMICNIHGRVKREILLNQETCINYKKI